MELLAVRLKAADPKLRRALYKRLRDEVAPAADAVRRSALDMPAARYQEGLREEIAATITTSATVTSRGVKVTISSLGSRMPEGKRNLPAYTDRAKGWSHPVFARGARFTLAPSRARKWRGFASPAQVKAGAWTWVRQHGTTGWFELPVVARAGRLRAACQRAIDDVMRQLS